MSITLLYLDIPPVFHFVRSRVLRCLKHNLLSSPKINIFNSFLIINYSKWVGRICYYFKIKNTFRLRRSYEHIIIYAYTHIFILTYLHIYIYCDCANPFIIYSLVFLILSIATRRLCNISIYRNEYG